MTQHQLGTGNNFVTVCWAVKGLQPFVLTDYLNFQSHVPACPEIAAHLAKRSLFCSDPICQLLPDSTPAPKLTPLGMSDLSLVRIAPMPDGQTDVLLPGFTTVFATEHTATGNHPAHQAPHGRGCRAAAWEQASGACVSSGRSSLCFWLLRLLVRCPAYWLRCCL